LYFVTALNIYRRGNYFSQVFHHAVQKLRRMVYPAILTRGGIHGVERIVDAVVLLVGLANDQ
jgi:hypothetical protein